MSGFLHILICVPLGYIVSRISLKKLDVADVKKTRKFEAFDRNSHRRPYQTKFLRSDIFVTL